VPALVSDLDGERPDIFSEEPKAIPSDETIAHFIPIRPMFFSATALSQFNAMLSSWLPRGFGKLQQKLAQKKVGVQADLCPLFMFYHCQIGEDDWKTKSAAATSSGD